MLVFTNKKELTKYLSDFPKAQKNIGFVPTMGALHAGHLALIKKSVRENESTIVSIFVNPTQFNNAEDLEKYPRTLEADVEKIKTIIGKIVIYSPSVDDIYEGNTVSQHFDFDGLEFQMEGAHRQGHFDGVGTVVKKLFEIVKPTKAYFGEKDFQQLQIVKKLVEKEKLDVKIVGCKISREKSGLAMSSRNARLSQKARKKAAFLYAVLKEAKIYFSEHSADQTRYWVEQQFLKHPDFRLEYFEIAEEVTLLPCKYKRNAVRYRAFLAVFLENIRLIDNISLLNNVKKKPKYCFFI